MRMFDGEIYRDMTEEEIKEIQSAKEEHPLEEIEVEENEENNEE